MEESRAGTINFAADLQADGIKDNSFSTTCQIICGERIPRRECFRGSTGQEFARILLNTAETVLVAKTLLPSKYLQPH